MEIPKIIDMKVIKRLKLKIITKIQKILLRSDREILAKLYYFLAKLHFSIYFDGELSLEEEILNNSESGYLAAKRHSRLVVKTLYSESADIRKKMVRAAARGAFVKNIILTAKI